jgi:hypothetical protein
MAMKGHVPGGGIASNKITERPIRTGTGSHSTRPGYVRNWETKWATTLLTTKTPATPAKGCTTDATFIPSCSEIKKLWT